MERKSNVTVKSYLEVQEIDGGFAIFLVTGEIIYHPKLKKTETQLVRVRKLSPIYADENKARRMLPGYKLEGLTQ